MSCDLTEFLVTDDLENSTYYDKDTHSSKPDVYLENETLHNEIQQKDDKMREMKSEFELFMNKVCAENRKLEQKLFETGELASIEKKKLEKENKEYKSRIATLEDEVLRCRNQIANFLSSFDFENYKKTMEEKDLEIQRNEKKIEALTMRMRSMSETNDALLEENDHLKDRLDKIELVFKKAKIDVIEYCTEIRKYDEMALGMEKQLTRYNEILFTLQDKFLQENMDKTLLEEELEILSKQFLEEKENNEYLKKDMKVIRERYRQNESSLKDYKDKLEVTNAELTCYKENLDRLRNKLTEKRKSLGFSNEETEVFHNIKPRISHSCGPFQNFQTKEISRSKKIMEAKNKYKLLGETINYNASAGTSHRTSMKNSFNFKCISGGRTNRLIAGVNNSLRKHIYRESPCEARANTL